MPACTKDRESVLFFLRRETAHVMLSAQQDSISCQLKRGTLCCVPKPRKAPGGSELVLWCLGRGAQLNPGPAAPLPGSRRGKGCAEVLRLPDVWSVLWEALLPQNGLQVEFPVTATLRPMGGPDSGWE